MFLAILLGKPRKIQDTGWLNFSTFVDDASVGTKVWSNPGNAATSNDARAITSYSQAGKSGAISHYLKATGAGASVPGGAVIKGIEARIERSKALNNALGNKDSSVKIVKGGSISGSEKADTSTVWPDSDTYKVYGSPSDLWGLSWVASDISSANFGLVVSANMNPGDNNTVDMRVDHMQIRVTYEA